MDNEENFFIKKTKGITRKLLNNKLDYFITNSTLPTKITTVKLKGIDGKTPISDHYEILLQIQLEKEKSQYQDPLITKDF